MTADQLIELINIQISEIDKVVEEHADRDEYFPPGAVDGFAQRFRDIVTRYQQEQDAADRE